MSVQQPSSPTNVQPSATPHVVGGNGGSMGVEVGAQADLVPAADNLDALLHGKAFNEADIVAVGTSKPSHPHIEMQVIQTPQAPTPVVALDSPFVPEPTSSPAGLTSNTTEAAKDKTTTDDTTTTTEEEEKPSSAWRRFVDGITHDPLNDPEFVEAYHVWQKQNRKERYDRRRAWIVAHGCKVGCLFGLVKKDRKDEAWEAYREKLAYMED
ncbi:hypothetical protein QFC21_002748 [Naganishia friedmannii]|uniref:Uncharacterized protein n=1 Tax=Naganishia friedmannii TaxID=89922 RepID=A0ACC2VTA2_9TREE|nr:hypothetical protein QFC21_002748 [Naganishia friedmannii]